MSPLHLPVTLFVYFDFACPHSYLLAGRLGRLGRSPATVPPLVVRWRPLELRPELAPPGKTGRAPVGAEELEDLSAGLADVGLGLLPPDFLPVTRLAHQATLFAEDVGGPVSERVRLELFRAYFERGAPIGRRQTVLEIALRCGLDEEGLERALDDGRYLEEIDLAREEADRYGIGGTPTTLVGRFKLVGAAPEETLLLTARRAAGEVANESSTEG